jgi:hypothetical protein
MTAVEPHDSTLCNQHTMPHFPLTSGTCTTCWLLLVTSQRLRLFVCHCEECMMQICGAMHATSAVGPPNPWLTDIKLLGLSCSTSVILDAPQHRYACYAMTKR